MEYPASGPASAAKAYNRVLDHHDYHLLALGISKKSLTSSYTRQSQTNRVKNLAQLNRLINAALDGVLSRTLSILTAHENDIGHLSKFDGTADFSANADQLT